MKQALQKPRQQGKKEQGLCGTKTRTDEQNGPYVSGRVEEGTHEAGRRHSDGVFFKVKDQASGLTLTHTHLVLWNPSPGV